MFQTENSSFKDLQTRRSGEGKMEVKEDIIDWRKSSRIVIVEH